MPVYREGKLWRVKVWKDNRPKSWKVRGSKADAEAFEARKRLELDALPESRTAAPTFLRFLLDEYLPHAELRLKDGWLRNQRYTLATLAAELGPLPITDITGAVLEGYASRRIKTPSIPQKGKKELRPPSAVTVNNDMRVLRRVLSYARERGHLAAVPKWQALPERGGGGRAHAWSNEQVAALYDACAKLSKELLPIVVFLANTGCREGEALALTWAHVDLERGLIKIWPSKAWQPKSGRPREVPIADALLPWLKLPRSSPYVFPVLHGRGRGQGRRSWPARLFNQARAAAGLEGGPHTLRHTFASHFLAAMPDLSLLAEVLGHSDIAVTRLYKHLLPDHLSRARNAVQMVATPAAAEALALARWRAERKTVPKTVPVVYVDEAKLEGKFNDDAERATGIEPATSSLGSMLPRPKILKLLARKR